MKRIAIFAENLYGGGVQRILQIILRNFDYDRYDVTLYTNHQEQLLPEFYPTQIKQKHIFSSSDGSLVSNLLYKIKNKVKLWVYYHCSPQVFYRFFIRKKYDVGIAFIEGYATRLLSGAPNDMKKIAWLHIELDNYHWTDVAFHNREEEIGCYQRMDQIACVSQIVKEQASRLFKIPEKTFLVHNPIEVDRIMKLSEESLDECYAKKVHLFRMVSLGSLDKRKGYDRLISVVHRILNEGYDIELLVLGKGKEEDILRKYIVDNNLEDNVKLIGYVDNPYPYVLSADIYICSSTAEGYNTAVTEALILGRAVISTEVSGIREQLGEHSEYGIIVENSSLGLYEGIKQMLSDNNVSYYQQQAVCRQGIFNLSDQMQKIYTLIES